MPSPPDLHHRVALSAPLRALLVSFCVLTLLGVLGLFVGASHTDEAFAWTIAPPVAAAFLGAGYGAGSLLVFLILRRATWEQARWGLSSVLLFVILTTAATFIHFDRLHLPGTTPAATAAAWFWLAVYVALPPGMAVCLLREERLQRRSRVSGTPRSESTRGQPSLFTGFLIAQGVILGAAGTALFVVAAPLVERWPWALTPFAGRVTAAWLLAFALAAFLAARAHVSALAPGTYAYAAFGVLELLVVVLHRDDIRSGAASVVYVVVAIWVLLTGVWGGWLARADTPGSDRDSPTSEELSGPL